jgi:hypothetical protein
MAPLGLLLDELEGAGVADGLLGTFVFVVSGVSELAPGRKSGGPGHFWSLVVVQSSDFTTTARTLVVEEKMVVQALNYRTGIGRSGTNGRPNLYDG